MKKKLTFLISLVLILTLSVSAFIVPASSYDTDTEVSTTASLLINLDTDTVCYSNKPQSKWSVSDLADIMTFIIAAENAPRPEEVSVVVTQEFKASLPYSDGCLDAYIGETLTLKDLMFIMMVSSGSDAAYLIANVLSKGDYDSFVGMMNDKAKAIGCKKTLFVSPGFSSSAQHFTCCSDLALMYKTLDAVELYHELDAAYSYCPEQYADLSDKKRAAYTVNTEMSILNPDSPYYFRYATDGKYSEDDSCIENLVVSTTYRGMRYLFVGLKGRNTAEKNVFADARKLTTWAYLNLSDRKVIDSDSSLAKFTAACDWGEYEVDLYAGNSAYKTLPVQYETDKFTFEFIIPDKVSLPVFEGQSIGSGDVYYDGEKIDSINLVSASSEGVSLLGDLTHFTRSAFDRILPVNPSAEAEAQAETATEKPVDDKTNDDVLLPE